MTHPQITDRLAQNVAQQKSKEADLADRKLSVEEFAHWSGLSVSTANKMRLNGTGPRYLKFGRRVLYDLRDLEAWAAKRTRNHTSDQS